MAASSFASQPGGQTDIIGSEIVLSGPGLVPYTIDAWATLALAPGADIAPVGPVLAEIAVIVASGDTTLDSGSVTLDGAATLAATAGTLSLGPDLKLVAVGAGNALRGSVRDAGGIDVLGTLAIAGDFATTGSVAVAGTLVIAGSERLAALGAIGGPGMIDVTGALDLGGGSLAVGQTIGALSLSGALRDGTLAATPGALTVQGGTFDAMTIDGTLDLASLGGALAIERGLTVRGGSIAITGAASTLTVLDSETLDGLAITLGDGGSLAGIAGQTLGLGGGLTLTARGGAASLTGGVLRGGGRIDIAAGSLAIAAEDFVNSGTIVLAPGTASSIAAQTIDNRGGITLGAGDALSLIATGPGSGFANEGAITLGQTGTLALAGTFTLAALGAVSGGTLALLPALLGGAGMPGGSAGGVLDLQGGTLSVGQGQTLAALAVGGTVENGTVIYTPGALEVAPSGLLLNVTAIDPPCFAAGTPLATLAGEVPVEALEPGAMMRLASGAAAAVTWIGHVRVDCRRHDRPRQVWPVRIRAHAFAPGRPHRDIRLSPDHAVWLGPGETGEGACLVPVKYLLNGASIAQEATDFVDYFHVELAAHAVLLAAGLGAESYLDDGNRAAFARGIGARGQRRGWRFACAPLCTGGPMLRAARQRLLVRATALGFSLCRDADLHLEAGGRILRAAAVRGRLHRFVLPAATGHIRVRSQSGVPAELDPASADQRRLGARLGGVVASGRVVPLDSAVFGTGFHPPEGPDGARWRWTDGAGEITLPPQAGPNVLDLLTLDMHPAWIRWRGAGARR